MHAGVMIDLLEATLWQRQLGTLSEEMVGALVAQVRQCAMHALVVQRCCVSTHRAVAALWLQTVHLSLPRDPLSCV